MKRILAIVYATLLAIVLIAAASEAAASEQIYGKIITETAVEFGIDPDLALAIAEVESNFNPNAVGALQERGIFQLRPEFHAVTPGDVRGNARVAMAYLNDLRRACAPKYGDSFWVCFNTGQNRAAVKDVTKLPYFQKVREAKMRRKARLYVGQ